MHTERGDGISALAGSLGHARHTWSVPCAHQTHTPTSLDTVGIHISQLFVQYPLLHLRLLLFAVWASFSSVYRYQVLTKCGRH